MTQGGKRLGAGRPVGTGRFGERTVPMRIPVSRVAEIQSLLKHRGAPCTLPLYGSRVAAGFPSAADDFLEANIDLNSYLVPHPEATFLVRVEGESMMGAGIFSGDVLIVDRALTPMDGKIVIAVLDGELTVKRLSLGRQGVRLLAENPKYAPIKVGDLSELKIWGVVIRVIRSV